MISGSNIIIEYLVLAKHNNLHCFVDYGVVLCEDKFEVDAEATNSLRKEIIRTRLKTMDS